MQELEFLDISEVMQKLNYSDQRPAYRWLEKEGVYVLIQGKAKKVNRAQFLIAYLKPFIQHLKKRFPEKWKIMIQHYVDQDFPALAALSMGDDSVINKNSNVQFSGEAEVFLEQLKNL